MTKKILKCFSKTDQIVDSIFYNNNCVQKNLQIRIRNSTAPFV